MLKKEQIKSVVLTVDQLPLLVEPLRELAAHHNRVAKYFAGKYPILPIESSLEATRREMEKDEARVEVLYCGDEIAGYCKVSIDKGMGDVDWLYVRKDLRKRGIAKKLMDNGLAFLKSTGVTFVELMCVYGNDDAKHFYKKYGFRTRTQILAMDINNRPSRPVLPPPLPKKLAENQAARLGEDA